MIRQVTIIFLLILLAPLMAHAEMEEYQVGTHYAVIDTPVRTRDSNKVEVVEIFWYGCQHCYSFEPMVTQWKKTIADDVDFWASPAIWRKPMNLHARAFYTAKALGILDKVHTPLFSSMVVERKRMDDQDEIAEWFAAYGVERTKFDKIFNSFGVNSQIKQADSRARSYKITGTPEMIVNGKYRVSARTAGSQAEMLKVVDFLIAKERAQ